VGSVPETSVRFKNARSSRFVSIPISVGIDLVILLLAIAILTRRVSWPISDGSDLERRVPRSVRSASFVSWPISDGIAPDMALLARKKSSRFVKLIISEGSVPAKLEGSDIIFKFAILPSSVGIVPLIELSESSRNGKKR
jgi:hypothetical protein